MNSTSDKVHYTQRVYRALMDAMARPGKIVSIDPAGYPHVADHLQGMLAIGLTLLDQEVYFHVSGLETELDKHLTLLTLSRKKPLKQSDYVFVTGGGKPDLSQCRLGSFTYPDESTTVIYYLEQLSNELSSAYPAGRTVRLTLSGPGVQGTSSIVLSGLDTELLPEWQECNMEFPLGMDWIFVDARGRACCVPRSSKLQWEVL